MNISASDFNITGSPLFRTANYINGKWVDGNERLDVTNPASAKIIGSVPKIQQKELEDLILNAEKAMTVWKKKTAKERANILMAWHKEIMDHKEELAKILTSEMGKPIKESIGEIIYGASFIQWFAEEAKRVYGDTIPAFKPGSRVMVTKEPVGVVGAITPWNFPNAMVTRKCAPAIAAGCAVILKPSELTPFSSLALAVLAEKAGVPAGIFNIVNGDPAMIGKVLCTHIKVRKIAFTGSTRVGKILLAQSAESVKKVSLELGGNAPFIVFDDADIDAAVEGAIICKYRNTGQTCVCTNRFFVHNSVLNKFTEKFSAAVSKLKVAPGMQNESDQGPLINEVAFKKVEQHVADAKEKGAEIHIGGNAHELGGLFYQPTILTGLNKEMLIFSEETFGPVAAIAGFETDDEVIEMANDTRYGLASYFYTKDLARAFYVAEKLEYGMVGINEPILSNEATPFGGVKESGLGREGSKYGIDEYLSIKYTLVGGLRD